MDPKTQQKELVVVEADLIRAIRTCSTCVLKTQNVSSNPRINPKEFPFIRLGISKEKEHQLVENDTAGQTLILTVNSYKDFMIEVKGIIEKIDQKASTTTTFVTFLAREIYVSDGSQTTKISLSF